MDRKPSICMSKNGKENKHTRHISKIMHFVINGEEWNFHKTVWGEGGLQLADIGTKNVREYELNPGLGYAIVRLDNWQTTCERGVIGYKIVWRTMCTEWLDCIELTTWINEL